MTSPYMYGLGRSSWTENRSIFNSRSISFWISLLITFATFISLIASTSIVARSAQTKLPEDEPNSSDISWQIVSIVLFIMSLITTLMMFFGIGNGLIQAIGKQFGTIQTAVSERSSVLFSGSEAARRSGSSIQRPQHGWHELQVQRPLRAHVRADDGFVDIPLDRNAHTAPPPTQSTPKPFADPLRKSYLDSARDDEHESARPAAPTEWPFVQNTDGRPMKKILLIPIVPRLTDIPETRESADTTERIDWAERDPADDADRDHSGQGKDKGLKKIVTAVAEHFNEPYGKSIADALKEKKERKAASKGE